MRLPQCNIVLLLTNMDKYKTCNENSWDDFQNTGTSSFLYVSNYHDPSCAKVKLQMITWKDDMTQVLIFILDDNCVH